MKKWILWSGLCFALLFLFTSCVTKTETVTEYIPVTLDVKSLAQPLLGMRPADVQLIENVETLSDVLQNSVSFQQSYNEWHAYADALEGFITSLDSGSPE